MINKVKAELIRLQCEETNAVCIEGEKEILYVVKESKNKYKSYRFNKNVVEHNLEYQEVLNAVEEIGEIKNIVE